jgi:trans-aconitate methyltransferase
VTGIDASEQMLKQAHALYPDGNFFQDELPDLKQLAEARFQNILCSAVLMHLSPLDLDTACHRLLQLLDAPGCLIISFRDTHESSNLEKGKLYQTIHIEDFLKIIQDNQCKVLVQESETETLRNLTWHNFVIKK